MNKLYYLLLTAALIITISHSHATTWTITTPGFNFSPATITIPLGDTILFAIDGSHNAVEVSQATWNANGNVSNFGFSMPFGGGTFVPTMVKTYFYVCQPHANMGMKGQIIVNPASGIPTVDEGDKILKFMPNPVSSKTLVHTGIPNVTKNTLTIFDITGKEVLKVENVLNDYLLDVSLLKTGVYFAQFNAEGYRRTNKLVVSGR